MNSSFIKTYGTSIVFVHGLTGDRERTWTHKSSACFWPEDVLPADLPNARIYTYGYDVDVTHFTSPVSQSRIHEHAQLLLSRLAIARERTETVSLYTCLNIDSC